MLALAHCDKFKRVKYHITYVYCPGNFLNLKLCLEYWECRNTEVLLEPTPDQKGGRVMGTWQICLLFTSIVLFRQGECLFQSANNLTWTEAQAFCRRNQSSLIPGTEGHLPYPHWTGLYRRLSDWIHVLGCYDNQSVDDLGVLSTHALDRGSVGLCQERCGSQGRFALKECISNDRMKFESQSWSYKQDNMGRRKTNKSMAPDEEDFKSWAETQSECKAEDSYLYGNISLSEDSGKLCKRLYDIRSNTPETWLGVARQVFLTKDRGEENVVIIECQICWGEKNCVLVKGCDSTAQTAYAVCGDATDLLPTTTEPTTTTTTETHSTSTTEITTPETTTIMETTTKETQTTSSIETSTTSTTEFPTTTETQKSKAEKAIAVTASLTIVGLILVILGIIWKRRGNLLSNLRRNKDKDATEGTYKHYSSIYDEVILPGEFQKENMYEMEEINDHNSTTSEQLSNGGYTEREGLYENGVPPSKTASLTQPVPKDTVTSSRDKYQNMENINTKQPQESPPYITQWYD
uniref:C-type lectin domain-containing protein n=1 Tax=Magallana gigas TaxID=29159 RepID=K1RFX4_MAGGI